MHQLRRIPAAMRSARPVASYGKGATLNQGYSYREPLSKTIGDSNMSRLIAL
jgi:hypothetical protein